MRARIGNRGNVYRVYTKVHQENKRLDDSNVRRIVSAMAVRIFVLSDMLLISLRAYPSNVPHWFVEL